MKKLFYSFLAALLALSTSVAAQDNLLSNPGFEIWEDGKADDWEVPAGTQETAIVHEGNAALRVTATQEHANEYGFSVLKQTIASPEFQAGDVYEVTVHYYGVSNSSIVETIAFQANWNDSPYEEDFQQTFPITLGAWKSFTVDVPVPSESLPAFNFELWFDAGQTVIVDAVSMRKKEGAHTPYLTVSPTGFTAAETTVGSEVEIGTVVIKYGYLKYAPKEDYGTLYLNGSNRDQFRMEVVKEEETDGRGETEVKLLYKPTKATVLTPHSAKLIADSGVEGLGVKTVSVSGEAYVEGTTPKITADKSSVVFPKTEAGKAQLDTVRISSRDMRGEINARITGDKAFTISTNFIYPNAEKQVLGIEYKPLTGGTHTATITISSKAAEPQTITVSGTATGDITKPDKQGDEYPLDTSKPLKVLNENFDQVTHNEPFAIEGWKNIAEQNYRAWWGYDFAKANIPTDDGKVAKATLFNNLNPEAAPYEMWLYTPALDFKNAESKIFTFRVSASMISDEERNDSIELYYVEPDPTAANGLYRGKQSIYMPDKAEDNDEWLSYHIDLAAEGSGIADVFFMAFRVSGTGGNASSVSYYIDDVSFGRTDLPKISLEQERIAIESRPNATATTPAIAVTAENLTEPIRLTVGGNHKSKFKVSPAELPTEGGAFQVQFSSDQVGLHTAYVKLSSRGAADVYLDMLVNNQPANGLDETTSGTRVWTEGGQIIVSADRDLQVKVYSITGLETASYRLEAGTSTLPDTFHAGIYIVNVVDESGATNYKLQVK